MSGAKQPKRSHRGVVKWTPQITWWRATYADKLLEIEVYPDGAAWWYATDAQGRFISGGPAFTVNQAKRFAQEAADDGQYPNKAKAIRETAPCRQRRK